MLKCSAIVIAIAVTFTAQGQKSPVVWKRRALFNITTNELDQTDARAIGRIIIQGIKNGEVTASHEHKDGQVEKVTDNYLKKLFIPYIGLGLNRKAEKKNFTPDSITNYRIEADWTYYIDSGTITIQIVSVTPYYYVALDPIYYSDEGLEMRATPLFTIDYADLLAVFKHNAPSVFTKFTDLISVSYLYDGYDYDYKSILNDTAHKYVVLSVFNPDGYDWSKDYSGPELKTKRTEILLSELIFDKLNNRMTAWNINDVPFANKLSTAEITAIMSSSADSFRDSQHANRPISDNPPIKSLHPFNYTSVTDYNVIGNWRFNERTGIANMKLVAIAPRKTLYGEMGDKRGSIPMFWMKYRPVSSYISFITAYSPEYSFHLQIWKHFFDGTKLGYINSNRPAFKAKKLR